MPTKPHHDDLDTQTTPEPRHPEQRTRPLRLEELEGVSGGAYPDTPTGFGEQAHEPTSS